MKTEKLLPFAALLILLIAACDKDDDESVDCTNEISYPYSSQSTGTEEVEFRI